MHIDQAISHKLVYSLYNHEYLGILIAPYIVQLSSNGDFTYTNKKLNSITAQEFDYLLGDDDKKAIKILDECDQNHIIKVHSPKKGIRPAEFFQKYYSAELHEVVRPNTESRLAKVISLLRDRPFFIMGDDDDPTWKQIQFVPGKVSVLFHFKRDENGIRYYPTLLHQGKLLKFQNQNATLISNQPLWLLIGDKLYEFDPEMEGMKIAPFLNKYFIQVPKISEEVYLRKFAIHLIEKYQVKAEGFEITSNRTQARAILRLTQLYGDELSLVLLYKYDDQEILANNPNRVLVKFEKQLHSYKFTRTVRSHLWELSQHDKLNRLGLHNYSGAIFKLDENDRDSFGLLEWLANNRTALVEAGFELEQDETSARFYIMGSKLDMTIIEEGDWFDINARINFGDYKIPFIRLRNHILQGIREFELPNGQVAIIPEAWFTQLRSFFRHAEASENAEIKIYQHHFQILTELQNELQKRSEESIQLKIKQLNNFSTIEPIEPSREFKATLREYQREGLNWLWFLRKFGFGGILADDMGLGKTVQTLCLLLMDKLEMQASGQSKLTSLLIVPTSILHNWYSESKKFSPDLSILIHAGTQRYKTDKWFNSYDLIITSYGTLRVDLDIFKHINFNYIVIDEGQNIKNPSSQISKAVRSLKGKNKIVLSGTPVENSVIDLWSIMTFANPGLLGTLKAFRQEYAIPIEKDKNETVANKLKSLINPFILRRTKTQVAKDLPDRIEQVHFCDMTDSQESIYEKMKAAFRNEILDSIQKNGLFRSQMLLLRGLTVLRQVANHPAMIDETYHESSGKFEEVMRMLHNALHEGHKILVFSQFVKHLRIVKERLLHERILFSYLDGQTPRERRPELVHEFNHSSEIKVFLISLKAGGLGLNLTSADYVILLDPWWNPAVEQQAIDRSHRIGQTKKVISYRFITKNSVEEKILTLQHKKKVLSESLVTAESSLVKSLNVEEIQAILS